MALFFILISILSVQYAPFVYCNTMGEVNLGFNYDFDDDNSIGTSYDETCESYAKEPPMVNKT